MDLLHLLGEILGNMWYGPPVADQITLAILPVVAAALAGGAALGLTNYGLGGKERRRLRRRANRIDSQRGAAGEKLDQTIERALGASEAIDTDVDQTAQEVYGESIQTLTDRVAAGQSGAGAQIGKAIMAGGGDVSGSINTLLQGLTAQSNQSIQDIMNEYNERVDRRNLQRTLQAERRKDQLLMAGLGARENQFAALSGLSEQAFGRSARKATADKQFLLDAIGLGANVASTVGTGGGGGGGNVTGLAKVKYP